jgi:hypothetical protein
MYQKGACVSTLSVEDVDWRRYELEQRGGKGIPIGPAVILVHVASVNVPFTSEAKEAIADVEPIRNEIMLALRECGRKMGGHLRKRAKLARMKEKETLIRKLLPKIAEKSAAIVGKAVPDVEPVIAKIMNNVMVSDEIVYDAARRAHRVTITVTNYTQTSKTFELLTAVPHGVPVKEIAPKPSAEESGLLTWRVSRLPSIQKANQTFVLEGLDQGDFDETETYVRGLDEELVAGAEVWKGKTEAEPTEKIVTISASGERTEGLPVTEVVALAGGGATAEPAAHGATPKENLGDLRPRDRRAVDETKRPKSGLAGRGAPGKGKGEASKTNSAGASSPVKIKVVKLDEAADPKAASPKGKRTKGGA